jgi:hypothetical protein
MRDDLLDALEYHLVTRWNQRPMPDALSRDVPALGYREAGSSA